MQSLSRDNRVGYGGEMVGIVSESCVMKGQEASDRMELIWSVLARNEVFWGYRPATIAATGLLGIVAATLQPWVLGDVSARPDGYVFWWSGIAAICILMVSCQLAREAMGIKDPYRLQLMRQAVSQFVPAVILGAVITGLSLKFDSPSVSLLPGLWAIFFSLAIIASRPYLHFSVQLAALHYAIMGSIGIILSGYQLSFSPWYMAMTFGLSQCVTAWILFCKGRPHEC